MPRSEAIVDQRELIERARGGDHDAFAELVDGALRRLDAAARLILRDADLAQDAAPACSPSEATRAAPRMLGPQPSLSTGVGPASRFLTQAESNPIPPTAWQWAPDDSSILGTPTDVSGGNLDQVLLDPVRGTSMTVPWKSASLASWQRLAP